MKRILLFLFAVLALCACSSNDNDDSSRSVKNVIIVGGKEYPIDEVTYSSKSWTDIKMKSGDYEFNFSTNKPVEMGKKLYLSALESFDVDFEIWREEHDAYEFFFDCSNDNFDKSSYIKISDNEDDNRISIEGYFKAKLRWNQKDEILQVRYFGTPRYTGGTHYGM